MDTADYESDHGMGRTNFFRVIPELEDEFLRLREFCDLEILPLPMSKKADGRPRYAIILDGEQIHRTNNLCVDLTGMNGVHEPLWVDDDDLDVIHNDEDFASVDLVKLIAWFLPDDEVVILIIAGGDFHSMGDAPFGTAIVFNRNGLIDQLYLWDWANDVAKAHSPNVNTFPF